MKKSRGQRENVEFYRKMTIIYNSLESNKKLSFNVYKYKSV